MNLEQIIDLVIDTLEDNKAKDIQKLKVDKICSFTDAMIIATGTSSRHTNFLGKVVVQTFKKAGEAPIGFETNSEPDWVLVDLSNVVVHIMTESARDKYALEELWGMQTLEHNT